MEFKIIMDLYVYFLLDIGSMCIHNNNNNNS